MASRKDRTTDLTIRLAPDERAAIDRAAAAEHLSTSTWLRRLALLEADRLHAEQERRALRRDLASRIRSGRLDPAPRHVAEVEGQRRSWKR